MKRIQTWFLNLKDRPLLQAAIGAVFLGLLLLYMLFPVPFPSAYTEEEITDSLCIRLLHEREEFDNPVRFLGKEKADEYIIIGFIHPSHPYYPAEASILLFIEDEDKKGEYHYSDCRNLLKRASGVYHSLFEINGNYCIVINTNPELSQMVNCDTGEIYLKTGANDCPAMYVFPVFPDGNIPSSFSMDYAYIDRNGNEMH